MSEYEKYHSSKRMKDERVKRNRNRRKALKKGKVKKGDKKHIDHKDGNPNNNSPKNLRVISAKKNRKKQWVATEKNIFLAIQSLFILEAKVNPLLS